MTRTKIAAVAATMALSAGAAVPATSVAAKKSKRAVVTQKASPLSEVCKALGLDHLLGGLDANLAPLLRLRLLRVCEDQQ